MSLPKAIVPHRRRREEAGAVLVTVLLVMLALLGMGVTALWLTSGNMQVGANTNLRNQALYVAEMGIERARVELNRRDPPGGLTLDAWKQRLLDGASHAGNNKPVNGTFTSPPDMAGKPDGIGVVFWENIGTAGATPLYDVKWPPSEFGRDSSHSQFMGKYRVWVRNDTAELRKGAAFINSDQNETVVVRSEGIASDDKTRVVLEVTMGPGRTPSNTPPVVPAAPPVLCNSGKNACDENSSTQAGVVVQ